MHTRYVFSWKCHWLALSIFPNFNLCWIKVHLYSQIILNASCCHVAERLESSRNPNTWAWIRLCLICLIQKEEIRKFAKLKADCNYQVVKRLRHWMKSLVHWRIQDSLAVDDCNSESFSSPWFPVCVSSVGHTRELIFTVSETQEASAGSCRGQGSIGGPTFISVSVWGSFINIFITFTCIYCILMCCMNCVYFINNHDNMITYYMWYI